MRPIIGFTSTNAVDVNEQNDYVDAIQEFGGEPRCLVAPERGGQHVDEYLAEIDGLLLTGGGSIHPARFNQPWHPSLNYVYPERDEMEFSLFERAFEADMPVLGICRGVQVMNIARGGYPYQDIGSMVPWATLFHKRVRTGNPRHVIKIKAGSLLSQLVGDLAPKVISAHHQSVNKLGDGFVVTAIALDCIVEAIENPSKPFMLGVQYHPERMLKERALREHGAKLFEAFIKAAS